MVKLCGFLFWLKVFWLAAGNEWTVRDEVSPYCGTEGNAEEKLEAASVSPNDNEGADGCDPNDRCTGGLLTRGSGVDLDED